MLTLRLTIFVAVFLAIANPAGAQITPSKESLSDIYPGKAYSPYAQRNFPDQVFWGDTHLHTGLSVDAGLFGARLGLDEAYRFARGEQVMASSGQPAMGFFNDLSAGDPDIIKFDQAKSWYEGLQQGGEASAAAALNLITTFAQGNIDPVMLKEYSPGGKTYASIWERVVVTSSSAKVPPKRDRLCLTRHRLRSAPPTHLIFMPISKTTRP
jgi:hypothetical protein